MAEIIPKETSRSPKESNTAFYVAVFLLALSIGGYFLFNSFLQKAEERLALLRTNLTELMTPEKISLEKEIFYYHDKISKFSYLVRQHLEPSGIFEIIESGTHPLVWFTDFNFSPRQNTLEVSAETQSFESLGQQILILRGKGEINEVVLEKVSITKEGRISFSLLVSFSPEIFKN